MFDGSVGRWGSLSKFGNMDERELKQSDDTWLFGTRGTHLFMTFVFNVILGASSSLAATILV